MRFIINNENGRIRYVSGGLFVSNGVWTHPRFVLDDYELMVCIKGKFHLSVHGEKTEIKAGDALFLLPGEEHFGLDEQEEVSFYWFHFLFQDKAVVSASENSVRSVLIDIMEGGIFDGIFLEEQFRCEGLERLVILFKQLMDYDRTAVRSRKNCDLLMELILHELTDGAIRRRMRRYGQIDPNYVMEKVRDYIRANLYKNIQVYDLAERFGYRPEDFVRLFHQEMGITPKQYILNTQMERAKFLMTTTNFKIKEIAPQIGFEDEKRFMKMFKKQEGMSAVQYKKMFSKLHYNSK